MKTLYLDFNVISYLRSGNHPELTRHFDEVSKRQKVVFSPAHLEDIAVAAKRENTDPAITTAEIEFLEKIAGKNALRPLTHDKLVNFSETPQECYKRVIDNYALNDLAEAIDAAVLLDAVNYPAGSPRHVNNIPPEDVLKHIIYRELIALALFRNGIIEKNECENVLRWQFEDIKNRFSLVQSYINISANLLEKIGFYREDKDRARSRLHDVSHIIYAAYCDIFVSADRKLVKKAKAIYSLLGVSTLVLTDKEFHSPP